MGVGNICGVCLIRGALGVSGSERFRHTYEGVGYSWSLFDTECFRHTYEAPVVVAYCYTRSEPKLE